MESKLEDRPVITVRGGSPAPGADPETWERFEKWGNEVYIPMLLPAPSRTGIDVYVITKESGEYPSSLYLIHNESVKFLQKGLNNPARTAVLGEFATWTKRRVWLPIWHERYALIKSFRSEPSVTPRREDTKIENAPLLHIEGYRIRKEDQDKYLNWLNDYGFGSFIPLLMRLPGIKGYDSYHIVSGSGLSEAREWEYPEFLSAVYFEDMAAFDSYVKSPELLAFQKAVHNAFPLGLNVRWYVQYQLLKSWRK